MSCRGCSGCQDSCGSGCEGIVPETPLPSSNPTVVFDGDCRFCRRWIRRYWNLRHEGIAWTSFQSGAEHFPAIPVEQFQEAMHVIEPDGSTRRGAGAFFRLQQLVGIRSWPLWLHEHVSPFRVLTDAIYRWTARHRGGAEVTSNLLHGRVAAPSTFLLTRRVFLRCLGLIYLAAFLSAGWQLLGLVGSGGIRPAAETLDGIRAYVGSTPWNEMPTLLWLSSSDAMLQALWIGGAIASVLLVIGLLPMGMLAACWIAYLSITNGGNVFFNYQWDGLLLEAGFIAIFWAPFHWRLNGPGMARPSTAMRILVLWLLLRFMFFSGYVKLQSGDETWWNLTALQYHYWTQPLPTWTAWYMNGAALWFQKCSCMVMYILEIGLPFLVLGPRVLRTIAFVGLVGLQLLIIATGNYGFFNLLTIVLCLVLLDDAQLMLLWPRVSRWNLRTGLKRLETMPRRIVNALVVVFILSLSIPVTWTQLTRTDFLGDWKEQFAGYRVVNSYGLFRTMTTTRPEILIEASRDGTTWEPYVFIYKPGPLDRRPAFCLPNMPRLDWQMWFDGLYAEFEVEQGVDTRRMILPDLLTALAEQRPAVLELLETVPFTGDEPPRYLRWHLDQYRFTDRAQRAQAGNWWTRTRVHTSPVHAVRKDR